MPWFDIVFSSSVLHWVADHPAFLRGAAACLRPGGRLVVSCGGVKLSPKDAVYPGRDRFAAWFRTTWLPYTQRVPEDLREEFTAGVVDRYLAKHPPDAEGRVRVRMVRLEIDAVKV